MSKERTFHQKFSFIKSNIWFETSFHNNFGKWSLDLQKCEKSILNKQVSNELASQMVIFSQWSDIQKGYSKTRDYLEKSDFSVVADAHAHPRDTRVPLPHPHEERSVNQLKKYAELFEKKVRVMVEEVCVGGGGERGAGYVFFSRVGLRMAYLNFNHGPRGCDPGRALATQFGTDVWQKRRERILFSELCSAQRCHRLG